MRLDSGGDFPLKLYANYHHREGSYGLHLYKLNQLNSCGFHSYSRNIILQNSYDFFLNQRGLYLVMTWTKIYFIKKNVD